MPPANNLIMSGTSIRSFRHLEHQNLSIILGDIGRARSVQQFRNRTKEWNGGTEQNGRMEERSTVDTIRVLMVLYGAVLYCMQIFGNIW